MYLRSAPLQKTPPAPRSTTTRTRVSRANANPALRRSCAVATSSELNLSVRSIVMMPTAPSCSVLMHCITAPHPNSANSRQQLSLGFGKQAHPKTRVEGNEARTLRDAGPHDLRALAERMGSQRRKD